jgi:lipoprotein-anchoring transpeptidase ErfK/SrfK
MIDYVPLLARAVAALHPNTREQRHIIYERARNTLADKLRAGDPTLSHTDLRAERAKLDAAILRVEADAVRRAAPPLPDRAHETYDAPIEDYPDRPPLKDIRGRSRLIAGAIGALVLILAGVAVYSFWPRMLSSARDIVKEQRVSKPAEEQEAETNYIRMRQLVYYRTNYPVGTIIVDKPQTFLYVVRPRLAALRYSIGVGPKCEALAGLYHIIRKEEWPGWKAQPQQSTNTVDDRVKNPLGARALYLDQNYRIHGTGVLPAVDRQVPQRCIALVNDDIIDLYNRATVEGRVVVLN